MATLLPGIPKTHKAVVTVAKRAPLAILERPTIPPSPNTNEVLVKVEWTASSPLDLHQNDSGLMVQAPQVLGDNVAGTVVQIAAGEGVKNLKIGDKVFGFAWRSNKERPEQEYVTLPEYLLGKVPSGFTLAQAVTLPDNFVTSFHSITADLGLPLPWPIPSNEPEHANSPILIWGGSSSVGQFALQILKAYGYTNLLATASSTHHTYLKELGARDVFDYRSSSVAENILASAPEIPFIFDCIGSKEGSLATIAGIARNGTKVAALLPVIVTHASESVEPVYSMDVQSEAPWVEGVHTAGVRTRDYLENRFFRDVLQPEIMPAMLANGTVLPNRQRIVEGKALLERAQKAMDGLRRRETSGERLVWRICEE